MKALALLCAGAAVVCAVEVRAANPIQTENARPGTNEWRAFDDNVNGEIEGYASATSVNQGESISLYVNTTATTYNIDIFRMGWYAGTGARRVAATVVRTGHHQTIPTPDPTTGLIECNWTDPYTFTIPSDWVSGVYLAKLTTGSGPIKNQYIMFVVREDSRTSNHNFQLTVTTSQAYNNWGGKALYSNVSTGGAARKVSFNRPYNDGSGTGMFLWRWEYNMVRFMEREGYDVTYSTNIDTHRRPSLLLNHRSFLSVGHDEYWSWEMRSNVEAALAAGVNLGIFSANTCYWQVRFEPSAINGVPDRTMVAYKEVALQEDPYALDKDHSNDNRITTQFRLSPVNHPESALLGVEYIYYPVDSAIVIDNVTSAPWVFEGTGLVTGSTLPGLLGHEVDAMDQFSPAGTVRLGHSPFTDTSTNTTRYSDMTVYTTGNATVFATGSIQWAWGLDDWNSNSRGGSRLSAPAKQITRNVLRRLAGNTSPNDCMFSISPMSSGTTSAAGQGSITITVGDHCDWTATSSAPWLHVTSPASGSGSSTVAYTYDANGGPSTRTANITIGDKTFTLTQNSCQFSLNPSSGTIAATGGTMDVQVYAASNCDWTASTTTPWIAVVGGASGLGNGTVTLNIAPTNGPARSGNVTIAGIDFVVQQSSGCQYGYDPNGGSIGASGGSLMVTITTSATCPWTFTTPENWITFTSPTTGSGSGSVSYTVAPNSGASRDGAIFINGARYNVHQSNGCSYSVTPVSVALPANGGDGAIDIATNSTCFWKSSTSTPWITLTGGLEGQGNGTTTYQLQPNTTGASRTGTIIAAGVSVTVFQSADNCTYEITPLYASYSASAATGTISVSTACSWSGVVESGSTFLSITSTTPTSLTYSLAANTTSTARSGTIRIGGRAVTITQNGAGASAIALTATATSTSAASLSWNAASGATSYEIYRASSGGSLGLVTTVGGTTFAESGLQPQRTYLYRVRALGAGGALSWSNIDAVTTIAFVDPLIVPRVTTVKAVHITQLRDAVNAFRAAAGLTSTTFTGVLTVVRASHILELRTSLDQARATIGLPPVGYSNPTLTIIRAADVEDLRAGVR
jgi:hypothetical protein